MYHTLLLESKIMNKFQNIFTVIGFKIIWICCIFGEIYVNSWCGLVVGVFFLIFFFYLENQRLKSFYIISCFSLLGYLFDSILSFLNYYTINSDINFLFLPIWFLVLWPSFSCLLVNVLSFLRSRRLLAILFGSILGPFSYYIGVTSGLANIASANIFILISSYWAFIFFLYSSKNVNFLKKI